jgi:hypothetical protein
MPEMQWDRLLQPDTLAILLMFGAPIVVPLIAIVGYFWHSAVKTKSENELKRSMVEQGMSADEIERILNAGRSKKRG